MIHGRKQRSERREDGMLYADSFEDKEGGPLEAGKGREIASSLIPPEGMQPCGPILTSRTVKINLCCFSPLNAWQFVIAATAN